MHRFALFAALGKMEHATMVFVRTYIRFRHRRIERVRPHFRRR
jgi:hypothetical protein